MENDPLRRFVVLVFPFQFESDRMRHRAPSNTTVQRMARILSRPVRSNAVAEEHVRIALALLHYWPSAFAPLVAELQRRRTIVLRRDRMMARRRQRRQQRERQQAAVNAAAGEEAPVVDLDGGDLPEALEVDGGDLPVPAGWPAARSP